MYTLVLSGFSVLSFLGFEAKIFACSGCDEGKSGLCGVYTIGVDFQVGNGAHAEVEEWDGRTDIGCTEYNCEIYWWLRGRGL